MLSVRAVYILSSLQLQLGTQTLKEAGVPKAERDDLEQIMDDLKTASPKEKPRLIEKAKSWVAKNQEFLGAAVSIVMKALPDAF